MSDIKQRELKMQEKCKETPRREFLISYVSWFSLLFYRNKNHIAKVPEQQRRPKVCGNIQDFWTAPQLISETQSRFFSSLKCLLVDYTPPPLIHFSANENCAYADLCYTSKNAYLSTICSVDTTNTLYSISAKNGTTDVYNSIAVRNGSSNIYMATFVTNSHNVFYARTIHTCSDIWFCTDLHGCTECIHCHGLQNMSYCINNQELDKEIYHKQKKILLADKKAYMVPQGTKAVETCTEVTNALFTNSINKGNNLILAGGKETFSNYYNTIACQMANDIYGSVLGGGGSMGNVYMCFACGFLTNVYYSLYCDSCSYCLGCIGLKNKSFCILNKQYEKDERFAKANEIFAKMDTDGDLGKFFPGSMNPFYFNDTVAYLIDDSFTKEEVVKEGFLRRDEEIKVDIPEGSEIVLTSPQPSTLDGYGGPTGEGAKLPSLSDFQGFDVNGNRAINPDILKKVIRDPKGNVYRIVKMEYDFLVKYGLPLPELHWLDRIKLGFKFK